jgi:hypothetical protein
LTGNPDLIEQYKLIHANSVYGASSIKNLRFLRPEIQLLKPRSILDYGCGQSRLLDELKLGYPCELIRYDPAIPAHARKPDVPADLLINIDVLEHIEEEDLDLVVGEMASLCKHAIIIVDTKPASAILPDGRNAHVTIRPRAWWQQRLSRYFPELHPVATARSSRAGFRTWPRGTVQSVSYAGLRAGETVRYYAARLVAKASSH